MLKRSGLAATILGLFVALASAATADVPPGMVPNQDQALAQANAFLVELDLGRFRSAFSRLGVQARSLKPPDAFALHARGLTTRLGGPSRGRIPIEASPASMISGASRRGEYFQIRFRAMYPVGVVFQDVSLEREPDGIWRVVGWWVRPASY